MCDWHEMAERRQHAEAEGKTLTVVAVGDRHADIRERFNEGPANVFLDGVFQVRYDVLPRACTC